MSDYGNRAVVVDTQGSPHARLQPVPIGAVTLDDGFWAPRLQTNRRRTIPEQYRIIEKTGRLDNFRRAAGTKNVDFRGIYFNDSDVYKWLEAACWALASGPDGDIEGMVEESIDAIESAQQEDGYLNTYFMFEHEGERWQNLRDMHELYCAGHMLQAAVAHHRVTGGERMLAVARRFADLLCRTFGPGESRRDGAAGHAQIEMALVELARATGEQRYLDQAKFFVDARGRGAAGGDEYHQDHIPFREFRRMVGHAVRAVYLNVGATDLYAEIGEAALETALRAMWHNMARRQMYVTGGVGCRYQGEAFGRDYELPNERAYTETCAAIAGIMWNWRMLALRAEARFADVLERILYNGFLSGLSLDGLSYFYQNPLADDGTHRRTPWFHCACCPPNISRMLASLPGYFYSTSREGVWVHLYAAGTARMELPDGNTVALRQRTRYPWDGSIEVQVDGEGEFSIFLRIPEWSLDEARLALPSGETKEPKAGTYVELRRSWKSGDKINLSLPMKVLKMAAHPYVTQNLQRVALCRGPLVYCVEEADNPGIDPRDVVLPGPGSVWETSLRSELLGGVTVLQSEAEVHSPAPEWQDRLYLPLGLSEQENSLSPGTVPRGTAELTAIPYYAWANRSAGRMQVWLHTR